MGEKRGLELSWQQVLAGALAATTSAVLLSTVGVAGTLIGAAVGSVAATVGSAVYSHYLSLSQERLALARNAARARVTRTRPAASPEASPVDEPARASRWRESWRGLPWRRIGVASTAVFLVAMAGIVAFELLLGRPVSAITGGSERDGGPRTSVPFLDGTPEDRPGPGPTPTATVDEPGGSPTTTPDGTPAATATPAPSEQASTDPTSRPPAPTSPPVTSPVP